MLRLSTPEWQQLERTGKRFVEEKPGVLNKRLFLDNLADSTANKGRLLDGNCDTVKLLDHLVEFEKMKSKALLVNRAREGLALESLNLEPRRNYDFAA